MKIIRISFNDEEIKILESRASKKKITVQDMIRRELGLSCNSIYSPEEVEARALNLKKEGEVFAVSDLYAKEEWECLGRGKAGLLGRQFYKYIEQSEIIESVGIVGRKSKYIVKRGNDE